jgi:hypothetical protein
MLKNEIKMVNDALKKGPTVMHRKYWVSSIFQLFSYLVFRTQEGKFEGARL